MLATATEDDGDVMQCLHESSELRLNNVLTSDSLVQYNSRR